MIGTRASASTDVKGVAVLGFAFLLLRLVALARTRSRVEDVSVLLLALFLLPLVALALTASLVKVKARLGFAGVASRGRARARARLDVERVPILFFAFRLFRVGADFVAAASFLVPLVVFAFGFAFGTQMSGANFDATALFGIKVRDVRATLQAFFLDLGVAGIGAAACVGIVHPVRAFGAASLFFAFWASYTFSSLVSSGSMELEKMTHTPLHAFTVLVQVEIVALLAALVLVVPRAAGAHTIARVIAVISIALSQVSFAW